MRDKPSVFAFYKGVYIKPGTAAAGGSKKKAQLPFFFLLPSSGLLHCQL
jgi:hypothetical protein